MPKKAVAIYLILALFGAALFIYFTFPRTKDEIPKSNNQVPFPSAPGPNDMPPVPETVPHPSTPATPHGPSLRIMAWAAPAEAQALGAEVDDYSAQTGQSVSMTVVNDVATYRHDLQQALASDTPPDLCLIEARDFSGADARRDFADLRPMPGLAPRSVDAFTVGDRVKAMPDEFSVDVLFYNPASFARAGIAVPGAHWNWDVLEAMSRALAALKLKTDQGAPIYPLELPADFDFWNMLCTQAGHPALDADVWHLGDSAARDAQVRSLDFIHTFFQDLAVTAPLPRAGGAPGSYFARQEASMLIGPSELTASLPNFDYQFTLLPSDMHAASLARVNGWAISAKSTQPDAARALAAFLARRPLHAGWSGVLGNPEGNQAICWAALSEAVLPRIGPKDAPLAQFLNEQIDQLARHAGGNTGDLYARIQAEYQSGLAPQQIDSGLPKPAEKLKPRAPASSELRDM
jgi:ABC-type glycerol-3-phosphate transport system substrate-binding protein